MSTNKDAYDPIVYRQAWEVWEDMEAKEYEREMGELSQKLSEELFWRELEEDPGQIASMPETEKTYGVCLFAVKLIGTLLKYVPEEFKTLEMCRAAFVSSNYSADVLQFFPIGMDREAIRKLYFDVTRERIENIEYNALRSLAVRELLQDAPGHTTTEEEIAEKIAGLSRECYILGRKDQT